MTMTSVSTIAVIGSGTMGAGIAQISAQAGYGTYLVDLERGLLDAAMSRIKASLQKAVDKEKIDADHMRRALENLAATVDRDEAVKHADIVIEAVPEKAELKKALFAELERAAKASCIFATNTSSISIAELAAATARPDKFIGTHFFNPPAVLKLLEIVTHDGLSDSTLMTVRAVAERMDRRTITVKDSPGFATSRLAIATAMEAIRMLEQGVASAEDIDAAMEIGYRHPMGPLKLTDHVGLDVRLDIASYLHEKLGSETFRPPELLKRLVAEGKTGAKSGRGFYDWKK